MRERNRKENCREKRHRKKGESVKATRRVRKATCERGKADL